MRFFTRMTASAVLVGSAALAGCGDLLDVENPNNVTEEAVQRVQGAAALVNGAEARTFFAISEIWLPYLTVSDDLVWGDDGSRDAWGSLDQGQIQDPLNEFIDAYFPSVAQARWMADEAVATLEGHVSNGENADVLDDLNSLLARAQFNKGLIYMIIGETMEEFAFSDKAEEGPIITSAEFPTTIFGPAETAFRAAVDDPDIGLAAQAFLARTLQARAIREAAKANPNPADPAENYVSVDEANQLAQAVIDAADADWYWEATFSAATIFSQIADWVNSRGEPLVSPGLLELTDPIDTDVLGAMPIVSRFRVASDSYTPLTLVSTRQMHLILAEAALAGGGGDFTASINAIRALDELTPFSGQVSDHEMLDYTRRANLPIQGQRLLDMYRFGIVDDLWLPNNTASAAPGTLVPIGCVEIRANSQLDDSQC